jgi:putative dimethyl sulfoxide reductase chaperone
MTLGFIPLYKIVSLGFSYPSTAHWAMINSHFSLCRDLPDEKLLPALNSFTDVLPGRDRTETLQSEYLRLFDIRREVSPYETEYLTEKVSRKPFELADIMGFYTAFGFGVSEAAPFKEAPDHISIELEFMAILTWKAEFARERHEEENLKIVEDARKKFFKEHLATWAFVFSRRVFEVAGDVYYKRLAALLACVLTSECARYGFDAALFDIDKEIKPDADDGAGDDTHTC